MEQTESFGSPLYWCMLVLLLVSRSMDFLSTWVATPNLVLEGNPIAKKLGWKLGGVLNVAVCVGFAFWPFTAIIIATTSVLVAARNFQSAWLMRSLGEENYRDWFLDRMAQTGVPLFLFCLLGQTVLTGVVGLALTRYSRQVIPTAIGIGIIAYAFTVLFYTSLSLWRIRRALG